MNSVGNYFKKISVLGKAILLLSVTILSISIFLILLIKDEYLKVVVSDISAPLLNGLATLALLLAAFALRKRFGRLALAWGVLALAQLMYTLGDVLWAVLELGLKIAPYPSVADGAYLLYYPLFFLGILLFPSKHKNSVDLIKRTLDISIVMIASCLGYWIFLINPLIFDQTNVTLLETILSIAYPVGDLIIFFSVLIILYYHSGKMILGALWILTFGILIMVITDSIFTYQNLVGIYQSGQLLDFGWTITYVLITFAGIYQTVNASIYQEDNQSPGNTHAINEKITKGLSYLPYAWVAAAYILLVQIFQNAELQFHINALSVGVGCILGLLLIRQIITLNENNGLLSALGKSLEQLKRQAIELDQSNVSLRNEISERNRIEAQLAYDAHHDGLTGLSNRTSFIKRLEQVLEISKRDNNKKCALLFLDLDNFKAINDGLGHSSGDAVLLETAPRLIRCVRAIDTVARFGGDEFAILLEDIEETSSAYLIASRLQKELGLPIILGGIEIRVTSSIGIVQGISEYDNPEEIMRDVDIAMYQAKKKGKACSEIFTFDMRKSAITNLTVENDLRRGIVAGEFILHFQPIYSLADDQIIGLEVLSRWNHPIRGLLMPADFIEIAEKTGLIIQLGEWVLQETCTLFQEWCNENPDLERLSVYVNVSGRQITQKDFKTKVIEILRKTGFNPHKLKLEITENVYIENQTILSDLLVDLRQEGITFVIDDFGIGYSSLAYLKHMPVTTIKIDRSFIKEIEQSAKDFEIIKAIVAMAKGLGMNTVAEGIETVEQLAKIKSLKCTFGQGFFLSRPMNVSSTKNVLFREEGKKEIISGRSSSK